MRRWVWGLVVLAGLLVVAVGVGPKLLDLERYRGRLEGALRKATGWEPELGALELSVLPGLALSVSPARLVAPAGGSQLEVSSVRVRVAPMALVRGTLLVRRIELSRPKVRLVRSSLAEGWVLPLPLASRAPAEAPGSAAGLDVAIDEFEVSGGTLRAEDRTVSPPASYALDNLRLVVRPRESGLRFSAELPEGGGKLDGRGSVAEGLEVELRELRTEALAPFLGGGFLLPGGVVSGTIRALPAWRLAGRLDCDRLLLLAGEVPLPKAEIDFTVVARDDRLVLDRFELRSGDARLTGRGAVAPALDLSLELPETPLEPAIRLARAVFPLPLDPKPPGAARATLRLERRGRGDALRCSGRGELSATSLAVAGFLPAAQDVRVGFELAQGALILRVLEARAAEGSLRGAARLDSVFAPRALGFDGQLADAALGPLLEGLLGPRASRVSGATRLQTRLRLDVGRGTLDARALGGELRLAAREVALPGWDLDSAIRRRVAEKFGGLAPVLAPKEPASTGGPILDTLSVELDFDTLPWSLRRIELKGGGLAAGGGGKFDPREGSVDVAVTAVVEPARAAELRRRYPLLGALVGRDGRLAVPIRLTGPLTAPSIQVDLERAARAKLPVEEPEEAVEELLKGLLDGKKERRKP
jgi:hypothetical protein